MRFPSLARETPEGREGPATLVSEGSLCGNPTPGEAAVVQPWG
jgi:hypothetical protein